METLFIGKQNYLEKVSLLAAICRDILEDFLKCKTSILFICTYKLAKLILIYRDIVKHIISFYK
jgi:hypothetical protein